MLVLHVVYFELPVNSSAIQDLHFPVLSRTLSFHFRTFQGLEIPGKKSRTFQDAWEPWKKNSKPYKWKDLSFGKITRDNKYWHFFTLFLITFVDGKLTLCSCNCWTGHCKRDRMKQNATAVLIPQLQNYNYTNPICHILTLNGIIIKMTTTGFSIDWEAS